MAESTPTSKSIEAGYELSDLGPKNIAIFALVLAVVVVFVVFVTYAMVQHFHSVQAVGRPVTSYPQGREPIARPRFWVDAAEQLKAMRAEEDKVLHSYGWVDKQNGIARIPIERAMELLAERQGGKQGNSP